jgi:hypothetical protein
MSERSFRYEEIDPADLSPTSLRQAWAAWQDEDPSAIGPISAYRVHIDGEAERAYALLFGPPDDPARAHLGWPADRIGIAWGADATWADVAGTRADDPVAWLGDVVASSIALWLNDADAWSRRN